MDDDKIFDKIDEVGLKKTMERSYIDYAMSVIAARALPDVRDGLKPVQRRILHSMNELKNGPDNPHRKCARIVGDTMGKYHPHGDSSIYEALVKLAQEWNTRYPLVDGHGNFGSVDGDHAAAMRYTEARLSKISTEMMADIAKNTVDFIDNFDGTESEPVVLPSRYPNLLVNGTSGIAVGMATNIPPHNLKETINAAIKIIDNRVEEGRETDIDELMEIVKGPDFPTGAQILGRQGISDAYKTGRGKIKVRAVTEIETMTNGKHRIIVTELPYMVNKALLIKNIADLVKNKRIDGITDIRDESSREGMRVVIELRKDVNANVILNQLFKHTQLQDTFGCIMLALVDGVPKILNLKDMLTYYLKHQEDVVLRRTQYDLDKAKSRVHVLEGYLIALDNIDEVISIIRSSKNVREAKSRLIERFELTEVQASAIVDMQLRALTGLEREKIENEYNELMAKIVEYNAIIADKNKLLGVIKTELAAIADKYGDERRTSISAYSDDITDEELIKREEIVISMTKLGYIKRMPKDTFKVQNRGGKGIKGMNIIDNDIIDEIFLTNTHNFIMFFTNMGRVYRMKGYEIPESGRNARGVAIVNLLQLLPNEKVTAIIPIAGFDKRYLIMATKNGIVKKTKIDAFENIRKTGLAAITLNDGDELIEVKATSGENDIFLVTKKGMCIRFNENCVRDTGRTSMGVRGIRCDKSDEVIAMQLDVQGEEILFVTANGMGKRTELSEFAPQMRGGKGVKCYKITEKTGDIVSAKAVTNDHDIMMMTNEGIMIRMHCSDITVIGRITSGVKLMNVGNGAFVASVAKLARSNEEESADEDVNEDSNEDLNEESEESENTDTADGDVQDSDETDQ